MKILIINTFYYPNIIGGTENSVKILAENLVENGHEVAVWCIDSHESLSEEYFNGVKIYRGKAGNFNINARIDICNNKFIKITNKIIELRNYGIKSNVKDILKNFNPDVVHTNNIYGISPLIWKLIKAENIKIVHTIRDYWLLSPTVHLEELRKVNIIRKSIIKIYRSYFKYTTKDVDYVTAPSNYTLDIFNNEKYFENAEYVHINNALELDWNKVYKNISNRIVINVEVVNFIFIGALNEIKGIDKLLKVFNSIKNSKITLTICGDGKLKGLVEEYCNMDNRITYRGKLDKNDLNKEFIKNDVLIIPSMWDEPFGRVIIEANEYGLPIIGSDRGGITQILKNIKCGKLFNSNNLNELSELICYFSDRENIKRYYDNILKNIMIYSVETQIDEFNKIYNYLDNKKGI